MTNKSIFNNQWLADYNKTGYEPQPRMTPCLSKKGEILPINFFIELRRTPNRNFSPEAFSDFAPIILSTKHAAKLKDLTHKMEVIDNWKHENPSCVLLIAEDKAKSTPIKTGTPTGASNAVEPETNTIVSLP